MSAGEQEVGFCRFEKNPLGAIFTVNPPILIQYIMGSTLLKSWASFPEYHGNFWQHKPPPSLSTKDLFEGGCLALQMCREGWRGLVVWLADLQASQMHNQGDQSVSVGLITTPTLPPPPYPIGPNYITFPL